MPPSSASAPTPPACSPSTSPAIRWRAWRLPSRVAAVLGLLTSFLVLRGSDLTRLMVTLGVALVLGEIANTLPHMLTGGADGLQGVVMGPLLGRFEFDLFGRTAYAYSLDDAVRAVPAGAPPRPFAVRPVADGDPRQPRCAPARSACRSTPGWSRSTPWPPPMPVRPARCWRRPRPSSRSTCSSSTARPTCCWCWSSAAPAGSMAASRAPSSSRLLQDMLSPLTPQYWKFWIGLFLVVLVLVGRERLRRAWSLRVGLLAHGATADERRRWKPVAWSSASAASSPPTTSRSASSAARATR